MLQVIMRPEIYHFESCKEYISAFNLTEQDLILTNKYIYEPFFKDCKAQVVYQEEFGMGEPTDVMVDCILSSISEKKYNRIIAIGGGTVIDIAKILAVSAGKGIDYLYDHKDSIKKKYSLTIIPTTCGTGSEMTNISIVNRTRYGVKMGLVSSEMYADYAVLIPELLKTLPFKVFATSSVDALVHAVESSLSPKATEYTKLFGYKAIELILTSYMKIKEEGKEILPSLMDKFLIASNYAGIAFGTAGCAAVHALSYPLGGTYHVPHGESNYAMFTGVLKNYMEIKKDGEIENLNQYIAALIHCDVACVYDQLETLLNCILPKKALHEYGVKEEELKTFAESVMETQKRLMANNFVPLDYDRVYKIYRELY